MLRTVNAAAIVRSLAGYTLSMRLRHREAFYSGFLRFEQETRVRGCKQNNEAADLLVCCSHIQ